MELIDVADAPVDPEHLREPEQVCDGALVEQLLCTEAQLGVPRRSARMPSAAASTMGLRQNVSAPRTEIAESGFQRGCIMPPEPIICCIIAGIPSLTKPLTSRACSRIACTRAGSSAVSSAITPVWVNVNRRW